MADLVSKVQEQLSRQDVSLGCATNSRVKIERAIVLSDMFSAVTPEIFVLPEASSRSVTYPKRDIPAAAILII
ncbi:MAG TPA: hypothetical protein VFC37_13160 [Terracidiphilus sp.]|nr:hypothetical protein [Terracidiphilus sp.]